MRSRILLLALTSSLVIAACAGTDAAPGEAVLPFDAIAVGEPQIIPDETGTIATLTIDTNIDAVCAVAYGPTESLGALATDTDMGGGAHDDHAAIMSGLEPETTYYYRLQGVGVDGNLYRSDLRTFTTPAASVPQRSNAALGATISEVSSEFSAAFGAAQAIDGDLATEWSSQGDGDEAFITIDLGRPVDISAVGFRTREMSDGSSIAQSFTVTIDGELFGPFDAGQGLAVADLTATGQIVRFDVETSTGGNTGAVEVEVYEAD